MEFFKKETRIDFMGIRVYTGVVLVVLWVISIGLLLTKGINFGLDFTGGTQVEARFQKEVEPAEIREQLEKEGFLGVRVQRYGSTQDILIRTKGDTATSVIDKETKEESKNPTPKENTKAMEVSGLNPQAEVPSSEQRLSGHIKKVLVDHYPNVEIRRTEFVGSEVGAELVDRGIIAVIVAVLGTMLYIAFRFEYRLAVSAALGLVHDAFLIMGVFSLFGFEFDLATLASVLAVLGYSLNDTIVVFDRVRENFRKVRKSTPAEVMNLSINQTLSRTLMTSWMTLLVVLALLFFGGETLFGFSMAFFLGIVIGTFSSIYVSGALALWLGLSRNDLLPKAKVEFEGP